MLQFFHHMPGWQDIRDHPPSCAPNPNVEICAVLIDSVGVDGAGTPPAPNSGLNGPVVFVAEPESSHGPASGLQFDWRGNPTLRHPARSRSFGRHSFRRASSVTGEAVHGAGGGGDEQQQLQGGGGIRRGVRRLSVASPAPTSVVLVQMPGAGTEGAAHVGGPHVASSGPLGAAAPSAWGAPTSPLVQPHHYQKPRRRRSSREEWSHPGEAHELSSFSSPSTSVTQRNAGPSSGAHTAAAAHSNPPWSPVLGHSSSSTYATGAGKAIPLEGFTRGVERVHTTYALPSRALVMGATLSPRSTAHAAQLVEVVEVLQPPRMVSPAPEEHQHGFAYTDHDDGWHGASPLGYAIAGGAAFGRRPGRAASLPVQQGVVGHMAGGRALKHFASDRAPATGLDVKEYEESRGLAAIGETDRSTRVGPGAFARVAAVAAEAAHVGGPVGLVAALATSRNQIVVPAVMPAATVVGAGAAAARVHGGDTVATPQLHADMSGAALGASVSGADAFSDADINRVEGALRHHGSHVEEGVAAAVRQHLGHMEERRLRAQAVAGLQHGWAEGKAATPPVIRRAAGALAGNSWRLSPRSPSARDRPVGHGLGQRDGVQQEAEEKVESTGADHVDAGSGAWARGSKRRSGQGDGADVERQPQHSMASEAVPYAAAAPAESTPAVGLPRANSLADEMLGRMGMGGRRVSSFRSPRADTSSTTPRTLAALGLGSGRRDAASPADMPAHTPTATSTAAAGAETTVGAPAAAAGGAGPPAPVPLPQLLASTQLDGSPRHGSSSSSSANSTAAAARLSLPTPKLLPTTHQPGPPSGSASSMLSTLHSEASSQQAPPRTPRTSAPVAAAAATTSGTPTTPAHTNAQASRHASLPGSELSSLPPSVSASQECVGATDAALQWHSSLQQKHTPQHPTVGPTEVQGHADRVAGLRNGLGCSGRPVYESDRNGEPAGAAAVLLVHVEGGTTGAASLPYAGAVQQSEDGEGSTGVERAHGSVRRDSGVGGWSLRSQRTDGTEGRAWAEEGMEGRGAGGQGGLADHGGTNEGLAGFGVVGALRGKRGVSGHRTDRVY